MPAWLGPPGLESHESGIVTRVNYRNVKQVCAAKKEFRRVISTGRKPRREFKIIVLAGCQFAAFYGSVEGVVLAY